MPLDIAEEKRYTQCMTVQLAIRIPADQATRLDEAIARGSFPNRTAAIRAAVELLLDEERASTIDEAYRRGYGRHPQEEWVGRMGLAAFAAYVDAEERRGDPSDRESS